MAEQDIVERLRSFNHISDAMPDAIDIIESLRDDNAGLALRIFEQDALLASLRQQLAEARETARREALEEAAKVAEHHSPEWLASDQSLDWNTGRSVGRRGVAKAIRALSHPDREGERE